MCLKCRRRLHRQNISNANLVSRLAYLAASGLLGRVGQSARLGTTYTVKILVVLAVWRRAKRLMDELEMPTA